MEISRKPSKKKLNIVDILIFLLIAVFVAAVTMYIAAEITDESVSVDYAVTMTVRTAFADKITEGDAVLSADGKREIGKVSTVSVEIAYITTVDTRTDVSSDNGGYREIFYKHKREGYVTVTVTVSAESTYKNGSYYVNGEKIKIGEKVTLVTPNFTADGECVSAQYTQ